MDIDPLLYRFHDVFDQAIPLVIFLLNQFLLWERKSPNSFLMNRNQSSDVFDVLKKY